MTTPNPPLQILHSDASKPQKNEQPILADCQVTEAEILTDFSLNQISDVESVVERSRRGIENFQIIPVFISIGNNGEVITYATPFSKTVKVDVNLVRIDVYVSKACRHPGFEQKSETSETQMIQLDDTRGGKQQKGAAHHLFTRLVFQHAKSFNLEKNG